MATISEALTVALAHHKAGRLQLAEEIYRRILEAEPNQADALHLMGVVACQSGDHTKAVSHIARAIAVNPNDPTYHNNLGNAWLGQKKISEAASSYYRALQLQPGFPDASINLSAILQNHARFDEAAAVLRQAIQYSPQRADFYFRLGNVLRSQGRLAEAISCFRQAVQIKPDFIEAAANLGVTLQGLGRAEEAIASYRQLLTILPNSAEIYCNLGNVLIECGRLDEAVAQFRRALQLKPDFPAAHNNLGSVLKDQGKFEEAIVCFERTLQLDPKLAKTRSNLASLYKEHGQLEEAVRLHWQAVEDERETATLFDDYLLCLHYHPDSTPQSLAEAHAEYERRFGAPLRSTWQPATVDRNPDRPLRLGFISPDLGLHPVGMFLVRAFEALRGLCATTCYSDRPRKDEITHRFMAAASGWCESRPLSHQGLAAQIRADAIDILFDLTGHTANSRLPVFAYKPAPIQITWLGYEGTTGMSAMDYILADRFEILPEAEKYYCEKVLRMPNGFVCYETPAEAPAVGPLPAWANGYVTFGCSNNPAKITPKVFEVWAEILRRVPEGRLLLKYKALDDELVRRQLVKRAVAAGVPPERLEMVGWSSRAESLAHYNRVDIALDPFPFSGGLTTCDALWMGVPVVTVPGVTFASRHTLSHLSNVGLPELVATDIANYVELAAALAGDMPRLTALRGGLRAQMAASPLCDGPRFAADLLQLLRQVWQEWCQRAGDEERSAPPAGIGH